MKPAKEIDTYIARFPKEVRLMLEAIRKTIAEAAPNADEGFSYNIPTFKLNGNLVHFAAYKSHIGFYPQPSAIREFSTELSKYETSKGAIQFPLNSPLPYSLIKKIVKYRVEEQLKEK